MPDTMVPTQARPEVQNEDALFKRKIVGSTLSELYDHLNTPADLLTADTREMEVDMEHGEVIRLGHEEESRVLPATLDSLLVLGGYLQIPAPFIKRIKPDEVQTIFNSRLFYTPGTIQLKVKDNTIDEVHEPNRQVIEPKNLVRIAMRTLDPEAIVIEAFSGDLFGFDCIVPTDVSRLGDSEVGDVTRAGLRFEQDRKHNLSPTVQPYMFTLACTNGMECYNPGLKIDARGQSVEDIMLEVEMNAQMAFKSVQTSINALYDLRNTHVGNPERTLNTLCVENGISDRLTMGMIRRLPAVISDDTRATMYDLVNLITNYANKPGIRRTQRVELERLGGTVTSAHVTRCAHCKHTIG